MRTAQYTLGLDDLLDTRRLTLWSHSGPYRPEYPNNHPKKIQTNKPNAERHENNDEDERKEEEERANSPRHRRGL